MHDRRRPSPRQSTEYANEVVDCRRQLDRVVNALELLIFTDADADELLCAVSKIRMIRSQIKEYSKSYLAALCSELEQMIPDECRRPISVPPFVDVEVEDPAPTAA